MKTPKRFHNLFLLVIFWGTLLVLWPLVRNGFYISDDGEWMVIRLSAFYQSLREGQFPVRFLGRLNHSYGYPVANFLYPGFLYLGSFLHIIGLSFVGSIKFIIAGSVIMGAYFIYFWLRKFFGQLASLVGVFSYIYSPYLVFDIYKRGSVGEIFVFGAMGLALYAIEYSKKWLLPIAVAWLIVGHNSLGLLFLLFLVIYLFVRKKTNLALSFLIGLGVSSFFWLPALAEKGLVMFDKVVVSKPQEYFRQVGFLNLLGITNLLVIILVIFSKSAKKDIGLRNFFIWGEIVSLFFSVPLASFLWNSQILIKLFQFPFRFLALSLFCGAWLVAFLISNLENSRKWKLLIILALIWNISFWPSILKIRYVNRPEGYYTTNEGTTTVADEYLPRWVTQAPQERISRKIVFVQGEGSFSDTKISTQSISTVVKASTGSLIRVNTLYYPGWGVLVDAVPVPIYFDNPMGLIEFKIPQGSHNVKLEFRETPLRLFADFISVISLIGYLGYLGYLKKAKK